jgi:hypothetical protein
MTPAWTVGAWPPVLWQPDLEPKPHFVHLGTHVAPRQNPDRPCTGQTVWGGRAADSAAGVSWDWIEVAQGVVAMADPMMTITNLRLIGSEGEVLTAQAAAPHLNGIVHGLAWQAEVQRALDGSQLEDHRRLASEAAPNRRLGSRGAGTRRSDFTPLT